MTDHKVVGRVAWQAAQLQREKEHTGWGTSWRASAARLPWVAIEKEHQFDTDDGTRTLAELFDGHSRSWSTTSCSDRATRRGTRSTRRSPMASTACCHLHARDVTLLLVSQAPLAWLQAYKQRMGWSLPGSRRRTPTSTSTWAPPPPAS